MSFVRPQVSDENLNKALEEMVRAVGKRLEDKGRGAFVSHHEGLGIITEEYTELVLAVQQNDPVDVASEAMDVAVGAVFLLASMFQKESDLVAAKEALEQLKETDTK